MKTASLTLDAKYTEASGRLVMTGTQALIRLLLTQRWRDFAAGFDTGGYLSGYRGSPLGGVDVQAFAARPLLEAEGIVFRPGVNEDLALTSVWGTQMVPLFPGARHDGVFAMWYGKGPGVDRSGDALKHANYAGATRRGGVLVVAGDDHAAKSSTVAHQSEPALIAASVPVLAPASVGDILELGLYGWAASRHSGFYIGFKTVEEIIDATAAIDADPLALSIVMPEIDPDLVGMRLHEPILAQEARLSRHRRPALLEFVRANPINRLIDPAPEARFGIVTAGKPYLDVVQALDDLELPGIRLLKLGMTWPIEPEIIRDFATGLEEILVVEEKQPVIESQLRAILYDMTDRPRITGKHDECGAVLLKPESDLSAAEVLHAIALRARRFTESEETRDRLARIADRLGAAPESANMERTPHFCSGCPHNTSTNVPEGSRAMAGIGCHYMASWMDRSTDVYSHMGAEGAAWIGQAPFTTETHVFANLGDGTYHHSGLLAIRAAVAAGVNITYKILFNDAVAMTGGQHVDGPLSVPRITRQLAAEGVARIEIVTDEPEKYRSVRDLAPGVAVHHRRTLDSVQQALREVQGVSALIYDQTCATEKRRRRKRGAMIEPNKRAFINQRVCEGCGDCSKTSNCVSVVPVETAFGRKRAIDQSSCNRDFSCVEGFCPSFVTVEGGGLKKGEAIQAAPEALPEPILPEGPWNIVVAGIGGTGVVTIGALLGMAAHLEGQRVSVLDVLGLAQKGGAVVSHIRIGGKAGVGQAHRVPAGGADLLLGCDALVAGGRETLETLDARRSFAVLNLHETITGAFTRDPDFSLPMRQLRRTVEARSAGVAALDATGLAVALMGDAIASNLFLLGHAWQLDKIPIGREAIAQAITLNGQAVEMNLMAFAWGRAAAHDLAPVAAHLPDRASAEKADPDTLITRFHDELVAYQDARYAGRFMALVAAAREAETRQRPGSTAFTEAVARGFYRLMAYKDEYEVARLYTRPEFRAALKAQFGGDYKLRFHLAPPLLARRDAASGHLRKQEFGSWMESAFAVMARFRRLRGTSLDPFGRTEERKTERALIVRYESSISKALPHLAGRFDMALALATLPAQIRGYGHVKEASLRLALPEWDRLDAALTTQPQGEVPRMAAE